MKLTKKNSAIRKETEPDTIDPNGLLIFPKYIGGGQFKTSAERYYEGWFKGYRVIAILFTRRNGESWGKGKLTYAIDNERPIYKTLDALCEELNKLILKVA